MSKLTGWIDKTDKLDVQGIIDKYENECKNKSTPNLSYIDNTTTKTLVGEAIWSEKLEENFENKKTAKVSKTTNVSDEPVFFNNKTLNITNKIEKSKNDDIDLNIMTRPIDIKLDDVISEDKKHTGDKISNENNKLPESARFEIPKPPVPPKAENISEPKAYTTFKSPEFNFSDTKDLTKEKDEISFKKDELDKQKIIKTKKLSTVVFQQDTIDFSDVITNKTKKAVTNEFIQKSEKLDELYSSKEELKTVKFSKTSDDINKDKTNKFTSKMTKIFFNETLAANDLDLTKEINDADNIVINDTKEAPQKKTLFSLFRRKKN